MTDFTTLLEALRKIREASHLGQPNLFDRMAAINKLARETLIEAGWAQDEEATHEGNLSDRYRV